MAYEPDAAKNYAGLTDAQANLKLEEFGFNVIEEKKRSPIKEFLKRFWAPIPWMLEAAAMLEVAAGIVSGKSVKYIEASVIILLLIFNSIMSFLQEGKAKKALELLKQRLVVKARVLRNGKWAILDAKYLVPGDIVRLETGDFVPADITILDSDLQLDQSALTGESLPVEAEKGTIAYSGSIVKRGVAAGVVAGTGKNSFFGKTAELVKIAKTKSDLSKMIFKIVRYIMLIDIILLSLFLAYGIYSNFPVIDILVFVLVILIAAIPIALPATYTLSTALGAVELSKKGVLSTKLSAIEESASMTILCSDKTGTLTENKVALEDVTPVGEHTREELLKYAMMASDASSQDALDDAIFKVAQSSGVEEEGVRLSFTPFDPATKRTEGIFRLDGREIQVFKGQPKIIWNLSHENEDSGSYKYEDIESNLATKGERVLAVAGKKNDKYDFIGFLGFMDPEREDSKFLVQELRSLGVRTIMLTGDTAITAKTIASRLGIGDKVCERKELLELIKNNDGLKRLAVYDVFAGIYPEDKFHIVKALQSENYIVGMTGDGVNDSPALKQAEVGIAVSGSTDVAKAAASIVLTDSGLTNIVSAIKTSREIFQRMDTWVINKIAKTIEISFFTVLGVVFMHSLFHYPANKSFVITPLLVILLMFANDFVTMSISTDNVRYSQKPNNWKIKTMIVGSVPIGIFQLVFSFGALLFMAIMKYPVGQIQTIVFLIMVFTAQGTLYLVRSGGHFYEIAPSRLMIIASMLDFAVIGLISFFGIKAGNSYLITPVSMRVILEILIFGSLYLFLVDFAKIGIFRKFNVRP